MKLLRRYRPAYDIIGVKCTNHSLALVAARDRRVDLIFFDPARRGVWLDDSIANVSNAALEFNVSILLERGDHLTISRFMKDMTIALRHDLKMVFSSGGTSPSTIRAPVQLIAIAEVLGLSKQEAINSVSTIPSRIVTGNMERRSRTYVEEGVRTIMGSH